MDKQKEVRAHILELLDGKSAHIDLKAGLKDFPLGKINKKLKHSPHSAWDLLEHLRIAQWDILEFSRNAEHESPAWPDGYWPKKKDPKGDEKAWKKSVRQIHKDLKAMRDLVADEKTDLYAKLPHGSGQTILREALLIADHNAYHLGQIMTLKKAFEK
jgi:DinB superfamily